MPNQFISPLGDLEKIYITDTAEIDQHARTGSLWMWGQNTNGKLGTSNTTHRSSPVQTAAGGTNWKMLAGGRYHTAAVKTDGTLWTWGGNGNGELGDNTNVQKSSPVQTIAGGTNWHQVSCGQSHSAAVKTDGTLWLWGNNSHGQLGNNNTTVRSSPVQTVSAGNNWKLVACGRYHTAAIKTDGTLWCWGRNEFGQLGDNTLTNKSSPVQTVSGGTNWRQVACGGSSGFTSAIKTDGTLWGWGYNQYGTLGTGSNWPTQVSSPVQTIAGGTNWRQVACGWYHIAAIKTDGTLWTWGGNFAGELGDNTTGNGFSTNSKSSPVQTVAGGTNWRQVSAGTYTTSAVKTDGTLWSWGDNWQGQLATGNTTGRSSPVQNIAGGTNWKLVSNGWYHNGAIYFYDADNQYPSA